MGAEEVAAERSMGLWVGRGIVVWQLRDDDAALESETARRRKGREGGFDWLYRREPGK
jgi:hypothetical protein